MNAKLKLVLLVAGIAAAVWIGVQALPDPAPPRADEGARASPPDRDPVAAAPGAKPPGERPDASASGATPGAAADAPRIWLRGRLTADGAPVGGEAEIVVRSLRELEGLGEEAVRETSLADGTFRLDVGPLLGGTPPALELAADHPRYMPRKTRVDIVAGRALEPVAIDLAPAAVVEGTVVRPDGLPAPGAEVGVFPFGEGGPRDQAIDRVAADAGGRYRLRVAADGRYWLAAWAGRLRPAARVEELRLRRVHEAAPLRLRAGASISGRLRVNGALPVAGATVKATSRAPGRWVGGLLWSAGMAEHGSVTARVAADGSFSCEGLAPGTYLVGCGGLGGANHMSVYQRSGVEVEAPAAGVDLDVERAELILFVTGPDGPVARAGVAVNGDGVVVSNTDEQGRYSIHVRPGRTYTIEVGGVEGLKRHEQEVVVERRAERRTFRIQLEPQRPRAALAVRVSAGRADPPPSLFFGFFPEGTTALFPPVYKRAKRQDGVYRAGGLAPGAYRLVVRAGESWFGALGYFLDEERDVVLRPGEESRLELALRPGGRLRLSAAAPDGRLLAASCILRDAGGTQVDRLFAARHGGGLVAAQNELQDGGLSEVIAPLPPGRYTAEVSAEGFRTQTVELVVEFGRTTERELHLTPE